MYVYNVTIKIAAEIENDWKNWMLQTHLQDVVNTGCFTGYRFYELIQEEPDPEGPTYIAQYLAENKENYERYIEQHAGRLRQDGFNKWGNRFIAFRTIMRAVN
jgi:hypothetical protein